MTELLNPVARKSGASSSDPAPGVPPALVAAAGALAAAGVALLLTVAVALVGWFAADAGRYGDTRDAVRVGADAWLLAHGAGLSLDRATVTVLPLGLTLLCVATLYRSGRWAAVTAGIGAQERDRPAAATLAGVLAAVYAVVALVTAVLAAHPRAESSLGRTLLGSFLLAALAGGTGVATGSGQGRALLGSVPAWARSVLAGAVATALLLVTGASVLVAAALLADFGTAATVLSRLHGDGPGGLMYTLVGLLFVPNAVLLGASYLLGPGFAVGTGTVVSPTAVMLGPVPAFPLLAALPGDGATPAWTTALLAVPVVAAAVAVALATRLVPVERLDHGAMRGLAAGLVAAVLLTLLVTVAGGSAGPGRMADVGAPLVPTLLAAAVACGGGGLLGGAFGAWRCRRRASTAESSTSGTTGSRDAPGR